jgi:hypothetical protein
MVVGGREQHQLVRPVLADDLFEPSPDGCRRADHGAPA